MSEDFSAGSTIISLSEWKQRTCVKASGTNPSYPDRVEELKGKILEAAGLSFVAKPEPLPNVFSTSHDLLFCRSAWKGRLPELVDFGEDDGA